MVSVHFPSVRPWAEFFWFLPETIHFARGYKRRAANQHRLAGIPASEPPEVPESPVKPQIPQNPDVLPQENPPEIEEPPPDVVPVPVREPPVMPAPVATRAPGRNRIRL